MTKTYSTNLKVRGENSLWVYQPSPAFDPTALPNGGGWFDKASHSALYLPSCFGINPEECPNTMAPLPSDRQKMLAQARLESVQAMLFVAGRERWLHHTGGTYTYGAEICDALALTCDAVNTAVPYAIWTNAKPLMVALSLTYDKASHELRADVTTQNVPSSAWDIRNQKFMWNSTNTISQGDAMDLPILFRYLLGVFACLQVGWGSHAEGAAGNMRWTLTDGPSVAALLTLADLRAGHAVKFVFKASDQQNHVYNNVWAQGASTANVGCVDTSASALLDAVCGQVRSLNDPTPIAGGVPGATLSLLARLDSAARSVYECIPETEKKLDSVPASEKLAGSYQGLTATDEGVAIAPGASFSPLSYQGVFPTGYSKWEPDPTLYEEVTSDLFSGGLALMVIKPRVTKPVPPPVLFGYNDKTDVASASTSMSFTSIAYGTEVQDVSDFYVVRGAAIVSTPFMYRGYYVCNRSDFATFQQLLADSLRIAGEASQLKVLDNGDMIPEPTLWDKIVAFFKKNWLWILLIIAIIIAVSQLFKSSSK